MRISLPVCGVLSFFTERVTPKCDIEVTILFAATFSALLAEAEQMRLKVLSIVTVVGFGFSVIGVVVVTGLVDIGGSFVVAIGLVVFVVSAVVTEGVLPQAVNVMNRNANNMAERKQ